MVKIPKPIIISVQSNKINTRGQFHFHISWQQTNATYKYQKSSKFQIILCIVLILLFFIILIFQMNVGDNRVYNKDKNPRLLQIEEQNARKGKKNKNKNYYPTDKPPQIDQQLTKEEEKVVNYIINIFPNHKKGTIINVMRSVGLDPQKITNQMLQLPEDNETSPTTPSGKYINQNPNKNVQLECFELMNNLTDQIQIDQFQFQELFQQVSELIKNNAQINKILGNQMLLECQSSKHQFTKLRAAYLDELKIDDVDDDYLKSKCSTLLFQIQQFLLQKNKQTPQYKQKNVYGRYVQDFPSLSSQPGQSVANKLHWKVVNQKIEKQKNFGKTSYFDESNKKLPGWNQNSLYQLNGQNLIEMKDIQTLSRQYEMMNLPDLKIIYSHMGDLATCRRFLKEYYSQGKSLKRHVQKQLASKNIGNNFSSKQNVTRKKSLDNSSRQQLDHFQINGELKNLSLTQLRDFVMHQMKLRAIFLQASSKCKSNNSKKNLISLANENNNTLMQYLVAAKIKQLEETYRTDPNTLDLHGYFAIQVQDLVSQYIRDIPKQYKNCNGRLSTKTKQGRLIAELTIITGKGHHSLHKKSVLKPIIRKLLMDLKVDHDEIEGGFTVRVALN